MGDINKETDFTQKSLCQFLNDKFGEKTSGKKFNAQDIQQYSIRGNIPDKYGGHKIEVIRDEDFNLTILRVPGLRDGQERN